MDMSDAQVHAALRTFAQAHPHAASVVRWVYVTLQELQDTQEEIHARLQAHDALHQQTDERIRALEILSEDYAALRDAHDALQLEHADLEAAYFVLQRRVSKEE